MSSNSTWSLVAGVVFGVLGFFTGGATWALYGATLGMTAASLILGPDAQKQAGNLKPDQVQITQASESETIAVGFGTFRVAGNHIFYDPESFVSEATYQESQGKGGGGDAQQTGYRYRLSFQTGLCMGPIDRFLGVQTSPGYREPYTLPEGETGIDMTDEDQYIALDFEPIEEDGPEGEVRLYGGSDVQEAELTHCNYRGVCFAEYRDFQLGRSAGPTTYLFHMERMPVVVDSSGDPIPDFEVRGSTDDSHAEYRDANPAAVAWEALTNTRWGKGYSADRLDADSFVAASQHYAATRVGISTTIGAGETLADLIGRLRDTFGLMIYDAGDKFRARGVWDRSTAYDFRKRITSEDAGEPSFSRPALADAINHLQLEFTNRENNYQTDTVSVMDLAHIRALGGAVKTRVMQAPEIGTRRTAELLAHRMLRQLAYPSAVVRRTLSRRFSGLQPGDFVEFYHEGWRDSTTSYWRVQRIEDDETDTGEVTGYFVEDIYTTAQDGEPESFTDPVISIEVDAPLTEGDLTTFDYGAAVAVGDLEPILALEPNAWISRYQRSAIVMPQRRSRQVSSYGVSWRPTGGQTTPLEGGRSFAITGTIGADIPSDTPLTFRDGQDWPLTLTVPDLDEADFLEAASAIQTTGDDLQLMLDGPDALMMIGREIIRVGRIEKTGTNQYQLEVAIRGCFGTDPEAHSNGDTFWFVPTFQTREELIAFGGVPAFTPVDLLIRGASISGLSPDVETVPGPDSGAFTAQSIAPLRPSLVSTETAGLTVTVRLRPRFADSGAGSSPNLETDLQSLPGTPGDLGLFLTPDSLPSASVAQYGLVARDVLDDNEDVAYTVERCDWIPPDPDDAMTALIELELSFPSSLPSVIGIATLRDGIPSDAIFI